MWEEPQNINPILVIYEPVILGAGLICLVYHLYQWSRGKKWRSANRIEPWKISGLDFGLFIWAIICALILMTLGCERAMSLLTGEDPLTENRQFIANGIATSLSMLVVFLIYRFAFAKKTGWGINSVNVPVFKALLTGLYSLMVAIPIIALTMLSWIWTLEALQGMGWDINLDTQTSVAIIATGSSTEIAFLILLAVILAPVGEELVFRAGFYRFFKSRMPPRYAIIASAFIFAIIHANLVSFLPLCLLGLMLATCYEMSGNIMVAIFFHSFFNLNTIIIVLLEHNRL